MQTSLKKKIFASLFIFSIVLVFVLPIITFAIVEGDQRIVPCGYDGARASGGKVDKNVPATMQDNPTAGKLDPNEECNFYDFIAMINIIIIGTIMMVSIYAAISFMYAGYAYLTSGGSQEKVSYAKGIFKKVLLGYIIILSAWVFVRMIESTLLTEEFINNSSFLTGNR